MGASADPAQAAERLAAFADELERTLGDAATVARDADPYAGVTLIPANPRALGVGWVDLGDEVILETAGGLGGRWELEPLDANLDLLEDVVRSIVAGRVSEVVAGNRSRVTVTLHDGRRISETGAVGLTGCLPLPFWPRWGRRIRYAPYRNGE